MKNLIKTLTLLTVVICLLACRSEDNPIYFNVKNNSNTVIYHAFSFSYPDTTLKGLIYGKPRVKTNPGSMAAETRGMFLQNPTLQIFVFDANVIENTPWDTIVKKNMFLKRIQFTESELKNTDWILTYDGN